MLPELDQECFEMDRALQPRSLSGAESQDQQQTCQVSDDVSLKTRLWKTAHLKGPCCGKQYGQPAVCSSGYGLAKPGSLREEGGEQTHSRARSKALL